MHGLIMDFQLTIPAMLRRASSCTTIARSSPGCPTSRIHRYTYGDMIRRAKRLSLALASWAWKTGDRVATFCWNHYQHLEAYMAIPCSGAVLHTLNLRLHPNDLTYIAGHAGDKAVIVDEVLWDLFEKFRDTVPSFKHVIVVRSTDKPLPPGTLDYEALLAGRGRNEVRLPRARRAAGRGDVLHLGHHRHAQGRAGLAPRDRAALDGQRPGRHAGRERARHRHGRGADVPRQCLGHAVHLLDGRRQAGVSRPASRSAQPARADGARARDGHRRRADDLAGHVADSGRRTRRSTTCRACGRSSPAARPRRGA